MLFLACSGNANRVFAAGNPPAVITLLAFGDSLTAGYGLPAADAFPAQLEKALKAKGYDIKVINAGVSGDTTSGGVTRLDWTLQQKPDAVILALGANDMLRGTDIKTTRENLEKMLQDMQARNLPVLLAGMKVLKNMEGLYGDGYDRMYADLAARYATVFYPFFLDGVALDKKLSLYDGVHPNAAGIGVMVARILPDVEKLIAAIPATTAP